MDNIDNLNNLELGAIYSYSEICKLLEETERTGDSRKAQFTRWNSYITFEKVGRKLKIVAVFQSRLLTPDNFKAGGGHLTNSGYLLMEYFLQNKDFEAIQSEQFPNIYHINLFPRNIAEICGFLPDTYNKVKNGLLDGTLAIPTTSLIQIMFAQVVNGEVSNLIKSTLNSLSKKKVFNICEIQLGVTKDKRLRELSFDEVTKLKAMKVNYWKETYPKQSLQKIRLSNTDYGNLSKLLEETFGVSKVYPAYKLGFSSEVLTEFLLEQEESMAKVANNGVSKGKVLTRILKNKDKLDIDNKKVAEDFRVNYSVNTEEKFCRDLNYRNAVFREDALGEFNRLIEEYLTIEDSMFL
jgi:hypothetical protein